ncbi:4-hydroxybenzoate 3-monooxygenase [Bradyrhizobium sp. AUGA SZCCT0222]|uniref:4-hydroxybenzoate 3-monooxygenase n=1 Tax=Bradyrhizobium sp. AUGA SZCCT0222 TaxID=2807668 RepID=UPI001BAD5DCA|nr:4-hydroxybenzoate 3-monooxygenase [Bradyrhizobium sp. AUGA SZCCT0222]MBR1269363.1 4-hydroxybenzoate 3-monooxygenase [Bradyrhizobium sp. AUGA SZCCT0222]
MRTQVGIIGAGPAGLFLSHLLHRAGIECVVVEAQSRSYVEGRVRAGVLEPGTVETLEMLGLDARMRREGMVDEGLDIRFRGKSIHLDLPALTGKRVMIYGQQEVVKDLIEARLEASQPILFEAKVSGLSDLDGDRAKIRFSHGGRDQSLECDYIAGCDGFHGVSRSAAPPGHIISYERVYDFAWLGVLSRSKPISDMTYTNSDRGFALCSRRSNAVSRLYLQIDANDDHKAWSDDRFWDELHARMFDEGRTEIAEGEIFQRDIARLRSFVASPMQYGRLLLAGDAVHITPPAGAKGLNLAVADARVMAAALIEFYRTGNSDRLNGYSEKCLDRVWKTVRFSTMLTGLLHKFPEHSAFDRNLQLTELEYILGSRAGQTTIAEQYVGTPLPVL